MQNLALPARIFGKSLRGRAKSIPQDPAATTKRNRIIFGVASVLTLAGSYFLIIKPENLKLQETRAQAEQAEMHVVELTRQLAHLRALEKNAGELNAQAAHLTEALPAETHLAKFILQVQEASNQAKLDWVSASPTPPVPSGAAPGLMESAVAMTGSGTYAAVQDFLARLENLPRAIKIGSVNLSQGGESTADPGSKLNLAINLKMFLAPTAPPLPAETVLPSSVPAPAPAPAPAASPPAAASAAGPSLGTGLR